MNSTENVTRAIDEDRIEGVAGQVRRILWLVRANDDWTALRLTRAQLRMLAQLQHDGPAGVSQLAGQLQASPPSITGTVDRLVRAGFVARQHDPNDRRHVINVLTPTGSALIERLQEGLKVRLVTAFALLNPEELDALAHGLAALERALRDEAPVRNANH